MIVKTNIFTQKRFIAIFRIGEFYLTIKQGPQVAKNWTILTKNQELFTLSIQYQSQGTIITFGQTLTLKVHYIELYCFGILRLIRYQLSLYLLFE